MGALAIGLSHVAILLAGLGAAAPVAADSFKWVDERGVTTYSNAPPSSGKQPAKIDTVSERVSVYTPDAALTRAMRADPQRDDRIAQLERENQILRRARTENAARTAGTAARQTAAYDRCVAQRRVDCEAYAASGYGAEGAPGYSGPMIVVGAVRGFTRPMLVPVTANPPPTAVASRTPARFAPRSRPVVTLR